MEFARQDVGAGGLEQFGKRTARWQPKLIGIGIDNPVGMVLGACQFNHAVHPRLLLIVGGVLFDYVNYPAFLLIAAYDVGRAIGRVVVGDDEMVYAQSVVKLNLLCEHLLFVFHEEGHHDVRAAGAAQRKGQVEQGARYFIDEGVGHASSGLFLVETGIQEGQLR